MGYFERNVSSKLDDLLENKSVLTSFRVSGDFVYALKGRGRYSGLRKLRTSEIYIQSEGELTRRMRNRTNTALSLIISSTVTVPAGLMAFGALTYAQSIGEMAPPELMVAPVALGSLGAYLLRKIRRLSFAKIRMSSKKFADTYGDSKARDLLEHINSGGTYSER
jgi:hypothetical protein